MELVVFYLYTKKLDLEPGKFTNNFCIEKDTHRVNLMEEKPSDIVKRQRKKLRARRKGFVDSSQNNECVI